MLKTDENAKNRLRARALTAFAVLLVCVSLAFGLGFSRVYATGSIDGARAVGQAWNAKRASVTVPAEKVVNMYDFYYDVLNKNHSSDSINAYKDSTILISTAQELMMFSYASYGYLYSAPGTTPPNLGAFMKSANIKLGNNIDYTGDFTYYNGSSSVRIMSESETGNGRYSDGVYEGYKNDINAPVSKLFLPIAEFSGTFDGQGFEIRNLLIWRGSIYNSSTHDAFFTKTTSSAVVENFGLVDARFTNDSSHEAVAGDKAVAAIVGSSGGTLRNVYALGIVVEGASYLANIPTAAVFSSGAASGYYTAANANGTDGDQSADVKDETTGWFTAASKRNGYFEKTYPLHPKRLGLITSGATWKISSAAQFVEFSNLVKESTANVSAEITADIDFSFIGDKAVIPMQSLFKSNITCTLYSVAADKTVAAAAGRTLTNLTLSAYLRTEGAYMGYSNRDVGLFTGLSSGNGPIINVYNLNFVGCSVEVRQNTVSMVTYAVGLIVGGGINMTVDIYNVNTDVQVGGGKIDFTTADNKIEKRDGNMSQTIHMGGLIGYANTSKTIKVAGCAVTGLVGGGSYVYSVPRGGSRSQYLGGIVGTVANAGGDAQFTDVYFGGELRNFTVSAYEGFAGVSDYEALRTYMGFLAGQSTSYNGAAGVTGLDGVLAASEAVLTAAPAGCAAVNTEVIAGGLMGKATDNGSAAEQTLASAGQVKVESANVNLGGNEAVNPGYNITYGGLFGMGASKLNLGGANKLALSSLVTSTPNFGGIGTNAGTLYLGGLIGNGGGATVNNIVSDRDMTLDGLPFTNVYVGGITGYGSSVLNGCVNTADITVFTDTSTTQAGGFQKNQTVFAFGLAYNGAATDCVNVGDITVAASGVDYNTKAYVSGISHGAGNKLLRCSNGGKITLTDRATFTASAPAQARVNESYLSGLAYNGGGAEDCFSGNVLYEGVTYGAAVRINGRFSASGNFFLSGLVYDGGAYLSRNAAPLTLTAESAFGGQVIATGIARAGMVRDCTNEAAGTFTAALPAGVTFSRNLWLSGITNTGSAENCVNLADFTAPFTTATLKMGGISSDSGGSLTSNRNEGGVIVAAAGNTVYAGGIVGSGSGGYNGNINNGPVSITAAAGTVYAGGVAGSVSGAFQGNQNNGSLTLSGGSGSVYAGGVGGHADGAQASDNINKGAIAAGGSTGPVNVGGVLGYFVSGTDNLPVNEAEVSVTGEMPANDVYAGGVYGNVGDAAVSEGASNRAEVKALSVSKNSGELGMGGIAGRVSGSLRTAVNDGAVTVQAAVNAACVGGIAGYAGNLDGCVNNAPVNLSGGSTSVNGRPYSLGGLAGRKTYAGNVMNSINYGAVKLDADAPSAFNINHFVGGLIGQSAGTDSFYIGYSANFGEVKLLNKTSAGEIAVAGGLLGSYLSSGSPMIEQSLNAGAVYLSASAGAKAAAGGLVGGGVNNPSASPRINQSANIGAVTVAGTLTESYAGGLVGLSFTTGIFTVSDSVNNAAVSSVNRAGGVAGGASGGAFDALSVINYGEISGDNAGGIMGRVLTATSASINGAVNYGSLNGTSVSAGIAAAADSALSVFSVVNYGGFKAGAAKYGLIGPGSYNANLAVHVDAAASVSATFGGTGTAAEAYYATPSGSPSAAAGVTAIALGTAAGQLYASDFVIGPGAKEEAFYGAAFDSSTVLAWSERPYLTSGGSYHSSSITAGSPHLFALSCAGGRRAGQYVGDNLDYLNRIINESALTAAQKTLYSNAVSDTKQITLSRDAFYYDPYAGTEYETKIILKDSERLGGESYQNLEPAVYNGGDTFSVIIYTTSPYYVNNVAKGAFTYEGRNTALASPSLEQLAASVFSKNAKLANFKAESVTDLNSADHTAVFQVARVTFDAYQGETCPTGDSLYKRSFTMNVYFADTDPSVEPGASHPVGFNKGVYLTQSRGASNTPSGYYNLDYDAAVGTGADEGVKTYSLKYSAQSLPDGKTAGESAVADWDRGRMKITLNMQAFAESAASGLRVTLLRRAEGETLYTAIPQTYHGVYYNVVISAPRDNNPTQITVGSQTIDINSYYVDVIVDLTNRLEYNYGDGAARQLMELPYGSYRLEIYLSDGSSEFIRLFDFEKEKSGDVRLHYDAPYSEINQRLDNGEANVNINFKAVGPDGMAKNAANLSTFSFAPGGLNGDYNAGDNLTHSAYFTSGITAAARYGTLPDFAVIDSNTRGNGALNLYSSGSEASADFIALSGYKSVIDPLCAATVSMPQITISTYAAETTVGGFKVPAGGYVVSYKYTVTAENGVNTGSYINDFYFLNPPAVNAGVIKNGSPLAGAADEMDKKESAEYEITLTPSPSPVGQTGLTSVIDTSRVAVYILSEVTEEDGSVSTLRTLVAQVSAAADGTSVTTPIGVGADMTLPVMTLDTSAAADKLKVSFGADTSGGKYAFETYYGDKYSLASPGGTPDTAAYYKSLPGYVSVNRYNADGTASENVGAAEGLLFPEYGGADVFTVEKVVSRYSTLRDLGYTTQPSGTELDKYVGANPTRIGSLLANPGLPDYKKIQYVSLSEIAPTNAKRPTAYRIVATYAAAEGDNAALDSLSYATYVVMRVYGEKSPAYEPGYIDEFASVYLKGGSGLTALTASRTVYIKDASGADTSDIDYMEYRVFLDEGERVSVRVQAENPLYYTDYDFVSYGPSKNKTFVVTVDAPIDTTDGIYTVMLKTRIDGVYTRTVSMLFMVGGTDEYRARPVTENGVTFYRKTYRITRNISATYEATVSVDSGLTLVMDAAGLNPDYSGTSTGVITLSLDKATNAFSLAGDEPATVYAHLALSPAGYLPQWGHQAFG